MCTDPVQCVRIAVARAMHSFHRVRLEHPGSAGSSGWEGGTEEKLGKIPVACRGARAGRISKRTQRTVGFPGHCNVIPTDTPTGHSHTVLSAAREAESSARPKRVVQDGPVLGAAPSPAVPDAETPPRAGGQHPSPVDHRSRRGLFSRESAGGSGGDGACPFDRLKERDSSYPNRRQETRRDCLSSGHGNSYSPKSEFTLLTSQGGEQRTGLSVT